MKSGKCRKSWFDCVTSEYDAKLWCKDEVDQHECLLFGLFTCTHIHTCAAKKCADLCKEGENEIELYMWRFLASSFYSVCTEAILMMTMTMMMISSKAYTIGMHSVHTHAHTCINTKKTGIEPYQSAIYGSIEHKSIHPLHHYHHHNHHRTYTTAHEFPLESTEKLQLSQQSSMLTELCSECYIHHVYGNIHLKENEYGFEYDSTRLSRIYFFNDFYLLRGKFWPNCLFLSLHPAWFTIS